MLGVVLAAILGLLSHPHRPCQREAEGLADGAVGFLGVGPDGVGGVLDGTAAGVEDVEESGMELVVWFNSDPAVIEIS